MGVLAHSSSLPYSPQCRSLSQVRKGHFPPELARQPTAIPWGRPFCPRWLQTRPASCGQPCGSSPGSPQALTASFFPSGLSSKKRAETEFRGRKWGRGSCGHARVASRMPTPTSWPVWPAQHPGRALKGSRTLSVEALSIQDGPLLRAE